MAKNRSLHPGPIMEALNEERLCVLATVDRHGRPHLSAVSWLRSRPPEGIDLLVGRTARLLKNIEHHAAVSLLVYLDSLYTLDGEARVVVDLVPEMPIPLSLVNIQVTGAYDSMFTGGRLLAGPRYTKDYPDKLAHLDTLVDHYLAARAAEPLGGGRARE
jgi:hypothetical protein